MNMTCDEIKGLTVPYLELDLEPSRVRDVTTHLEGCAGCRAEMEAVRQVLVRVRGIAVPDPGDQFWREFPHRVRRELERLQSAATTLGEPSRYQWSWGGPVTARRTLALAALLLLIVGLWSVKGLLDRGMGPPEQSMVQGPHAEDLSNPGDVEWEAYWEDDPDTVLVEMAAQLDRQTMDRLFADI
jgi:predicted anti-sigma-YlaC factor YlaD